MTTAWLNDSDFVLLQETYVSIDNHDNNVILDQNARKAPQLFISGDQVDSI